MTTFISDELFHFVGHAHPLEHDANYATLKLVLGRGCISHPPHNDDWGTVANRVDLSKSLFTEEMLIPTVTCFCDIPFLSLPLHMSKYGNFGVALSRHHLVKYGARPVMYIPIRRDDWHSSRGGGTAVLKSIETTFRGLKSQLAEADKVGQKRSSFPTREPLNPEDAVRHLDRTLALEILAYLKPFDSLLEASDPYYFYSEREWRKYGNMRFKPEDVTRVIVHKSYITQAKIDYPEYAGVICAAPD
jgi:Putative abortive phage resistance protein AbiGi, antitoxin